MLLDMIGNRRVNIGNLPSVIRLLASFDSSSLLGADVPYGRAENKCSSDLWNSWNRSNNGAIAPLMDGRRTSTLCYKERIKINQETDYHTIDMSTMLMKVKA